MSAPPSSPRRSPLEAFLDERAARLVELLGELEVAAPDVAAWLKRFERPRPPRPVCAARAAELVDEIQKLAGEL